VRGVHRDANRASEGVTPRARMKVLIVDDETVARNRLRRMLASAEDVDIVGEAADGRSAVDAILQLRPDLVFLDIQMPELNGFDVLTALAPQELPDFVFVTAYDEYALRAFEVNAMDYLLKPYEADRLDVTLQRARHRRNGGASDDRHKLFSMLQQVAEEQRALRDAVDRAMPASAAAGDRRQLERLMIKSRGRTFFVKVAEIDYIESAANYVRLHIGTDAHRLRMKISDLAAQLDPTQFVRIHRTTVVNLSRVREIQPWFSGDAVVILLNGTKLRLSRFHRSALEGRFMHHAE
jgi:two-component system, LytTR family, response regulator